MSASLPALPVRRAVLTVVGVAAVLQALMVFAFTWPAGRTGPREVPVVLAGPAAATERLAADLEQAHPGALDVSLAPTAGAARAALHRREAYGAVVLDPTGPRVLVATAASPAVSQLLTGVAADLAPGPRVPVRDVVPPPRDDPRGGVLSALVLPLVMTSVIGGAGLALLVRPGRAVAAGVLGLAVVGGLAVTTIGHLALGGLTGSFLAEAGVIGLTVLAVSATVAGAGALGGHAAIVPASITMMMLGNPMSGASTAPELLPAPWGALGQLLPPGAGSQALRSVAFFDGAAAGSKVVVLLVWAGLGLSLVAAAARRAGRARSAPDGATERPPAPTAVAA